MYVCICIYNGSTKIYTKVKIDKHQTPKYSKGI